MKNWICWSAMLLLVAEVISVQRSQPVAVKSANADIALANQLILVEKQFWQSWKDGKPQVFEELMTTDAVFFGQFGVSSKAEVMQQQKESVEACRVEGYVLKNPRTVAIDNDAAILLYEANQNATCGGVKVQPLMHGSSVYVHREGKWLNVYRSEVPPAQ